MRCSLHQDRQGTRRTEVTARPATQPDPARPGHSSAPMNLHPHRELRSRRTNRPRPPHLRQPGFFIPAIPISTLSHLPKVRSIPAKSSHLRKESSCALPATASVAAFSFRPALSHLPKVRYFPAKSSRLRKVSFRALPATASVAAFSPAFPHLRKVCSIPENRLTFGRRVLAPCPPQRL